ncbi:hypothetical protein McpAg1_11120 [Methanocorpusculaceae archaeon Ag1]|uniref:TfoX N-terminal domain-containing protein n=2 Tax=Methanorbis furvi TaxID=3028299 RepID=A0AAE4ME81_9EURY|nr:hypothetical protein [Methanocorpusculaceae archaeon Ag1]
MSDERSRHFHTARLSYYKETRQYLSMASTEEFVRFVCDQISDAGSIRYRKMFGEYGIYCNEKYCACICDNMLFVKITEAGKQLMPNAKTAYPYEGSKNESFLITEFEDTELITNLIRKTSEKLPESKRKRSL